MASVSIPILGDIKYRNAFNAFAREQGSNMATLVRAALDEKYGEQLKPYLSFFDVGGQSTEQTVDKETTHA